ncbi:hypothetical protein [Pseudomonas putida]|uniref:hypothetical protein n=1 Tax=Pseudomonas putida TaxID=303 RepID=UPI003D96BE0D
MSEISYPRRKVFIAFFLCPLVLGFFAGIYKFVALLAHLVSTPRLLGEVRGGELLLMPVAVPLIAQVAFLPPFLVLALVIARMKVCRTSRSCVLISLAGGFLAMSWSLLFVVAVVRHVKNAQFSDYLFEMLIIFVATSVTCWLAARFFLPVQIATAVETFND